MKSPLKIETVPVSSLVFDPSNARKHPEKNLAAIKGSLAKFGQRKPIVVRNGVVIAGNGTLQAAKELGWDKIDVVRADDMSATEATAFAIADNRTSEIAEWDVGVLGDTLKGLMEDDFDLSQIGFDAEDLESILPKVEPEFLADEDEIPEKVETICKPGDLWVLGDHRLLCGDSTNILEYDRLLKDTRIDCYWTDPPYNVNYSSKAGKIQNDNMSEEDFYEFLKSAFTCAQSVMKFGASFYIAHADSSGHTFRLAAAGSNLKIKQCLVWVKSSLVMGRQDYHWRHEPILYGWLEGAAHNWYGDRKQTTVLEFDKPKNNESHPTMKPVELVEYCLKNSTKTNDAVLDTFTGSGTTLVACEKLGRRFFGLEIDPKYCDVIITRWQNLTGKKAELIPHE